MQSGYVKLQECHTNDNNTTSDELQEFFFISTPKDFQYLACIQSFRLSDAYTYCKSAHTVANVYIQKNPDFTLYGYDDEIENAKSHPHLSYTIAYGIAVNGWENCPFQRIPPKMGKKNIRYRIYYPDQEKDLLTDITREYEFDRKTLHWIQEELSATLAKTEVLFYRIDVLEQRLYDYIHPDILDTISFKFEELKKGYDQQYAVKQA
ncbi:MAG: hypothetical protein LBV02_08495, partial [Bacteroidales bacterium]|nr:hypothetical protein [Bacteroidales bacterium]